MIAPTAALIACLTLAAAGQAGPEKSRTFAFTYEATVTGLRPGQLARVWLPVPPSTEDQDASIAELTLPGPARLERETEYGNRMLYVEAKADDQGRIPLSVTYHVTRREVKADWAGKTAPGEDVARFLKPDANVPVGGKPLRLIEGRELPRDQVELGRALYNIVNGHMHYSKEGTGWGRGDAEWACDSRYGNCSDFHSLFISLARSKDIPAKFEIGFPLPEKRGSGEITGYHCWAKFKPKDHGWVPVDISEANKHPGLREYYFGNLTPDRVAFSVGRDVTLAPRQAGPPLNFFIYPYAEVDGRPYPADKISRRFTFADLPTGR